MVWNLTFQMQVQKATAFSTDDVAAAMHAIDEALDLFYPGQYFLLTPQSNTIHSPNTVPQANSFKIEEYVTFTIPMKASTNFEIQFKIASHDKTKWDFFLPVIKLNNLCGNIKGTINVDTFCGK